MSRVQCSIPERVSLSRRSPAQSLCAIAIPYLRSLLIAWLLLLAGCATPDRARDPTPPVEIPESTWWRVDNDIAAASLAATGPARNYARREMEGWRRRVQARTESDFIPWFTDYWTQQWLAIKVAWYKLGAEEGTDPAVDRLASYLQDQYGERVLTPVAREIDPDVVRSESTMLYIQILRERLQGIPWRHGVPEEQFARRLEDIPAIALSPPPTHGASLDQIVRADPIDRLPAFVALNARFRKAPGGGVLPSEARISPVARRASESLVARFGVSVGAGAAAAVVGGVAGMAISLGAAGFGAIAHEKERPAMEAQLRESLNATLGDMWQSLMEDPAGGVMAGVHHICGQIEGALARASAQPIELDPLPREMLLPVDPPFGEDEGQDQDVTDDS